jgi:uncharacterized protein DUF6265
MSRARPAPSRRGERSVVRLACLAALPLACSPGPAPRRPAPAPAAVAGAGLPTLAPALGPTAWLAGRWASEDGASQETWFASGPVLVGVGFSAEAGTTSFWEAMSVDADDGIVRYRAMPRGREATAFELEDAGPGRASFENAAHDAPKRVVYERRGGRLEAQLFGEGAAPSASFSWVERPAERAPELERADLRVDADLAARGVDAWAEAFDEQGVFVRRGRRTVGRDAARKAAAPDFRDGLGLRREPAASGWSPARDLGFTVGRFRITRPGGEGAARAGTYLSLWALAAGGRARLVFDAQYDDDPPPAPPERALIRWPLPDGWRSETIPLPPDFARDLSLRGLEEVRFAPSFFDPSAETYFSYSFAWMLNGDPRLDAGALGEQLRRYFVGLMTAVGESKGHGPGAAASSAHLRDEGAGHFSGTVTTIDAFAERAASPAAPLRLHVEAEAGACAGRRVVLFTLSPRERGDKLWGRLREQRKLFRCKPPP